MVLGRGNEAVPKTVIFVTVSNLAKFHNAKYNQNKFFITCNMESCTRDTMMGGNMIKGVIFFTKREGLATLRLAP